MDYPDEFHNEIYEIFDVVPNNVLYGIDGNLYFIDTQIRLKDNEWLFFPSWNLLNPYKWEKRKDNDVWAER